MILRTLIAVKSAAWRRRLTALFAAGEGQVDVLPTRAAIAKQVERAGYDLVVLQRARLGADAAGLLAHIKGLPDPPEVVVVADFADPEADARLLANGALSVLVRDLSDDSLTGALATVRESLRQRGAARIARESRAEAPSLDDFESKSPTMQAFLAVARRVVNSDSSLLVAGETGVGKEWLARAVHAGGPRAKLPFVAVHCAGLPETLLESELFGHEEGAFTGAVRSRRGMFELAHGGTIFLDEIGDMPLAMQVKLLRVLQDHRIQRLGSERSVAVDVRVVAASHQDLVALVEAGRFRRDLYYRLAVVTLTVPPLRERRADVAGLVASYLEPFARKLGRSLRGLTPRALEALEAYAWPGNVRELINVLERAVLLTSGEWIDLGDLPGDIVVWSRVGARGVEVHTPEEAAPGAGWLQEPLAVLRERAIESLERRYLSALLQATGGRIGETARRAGLQPRSLYAKMKRYGLDKQSFKRSRAALTAPG